MANYANLKLAIQQVIKTNGNNEITGSLLQQSLLAMINSLGGYYQFAGIATPSTNPGTPDQNVFYLASTAGTYANFGGLVLADGEIAILKYNGAWSKDSTGAASLEKVNQLGHKVDDMNIQLNEISSITRNLFWGTLSNGNIDATGIVYDTPANFLHCDKFIEVSPSSNYVISAEVVPPSSIAQIVLLEFDSQKNIITRRGISSGSEVSKRSAAFTTGQGTYFIKFLLYSGSAINGDGAKVQIESGSTSTEYTQHWTAKDNVARDAIVAGLSNIQNSIDAIDAKVDASYELSNHIVPRINEKYLIDGVTYENGKYIDPLSGNTANNGIYSASSFIEVRSDTEYHITKGDMLYGAFYDANKSYISGIKEEQPSTRSIDITSPASAKYVRLSTKTAEIGYLSIGITQDVYLNPIIKTGKVNIITVSTDGSKDFTSLRDAFESVVGNTSENPFIVEFYGNGQEYDVLSDFSNSEISTLAGLTIPAHTTLVGIGGPDKCILAARVPSSLANRYFAAINLGSSSKIKGFKVIASYARNVLHQDTLEENVEGGAENCEFIGENLFLSYVAATGIYSGCKMIFKDCKFQNNTQGGYAFSCHNNEGFSRQGILDIDNCRFIATTTDFSVRLGSIVTGANGINCVCRIIGSRVPTQFRLNEENASVYGSGCLWKVTGYANDIANIHVYSTDGIDHSDNIDVIE